LTVHGQNNVTIITCDLAYWHYYTTGNVLTFCAPTILAIAKLTACHHL